MSVFLFKIFFKCGKNWGEYGGCAYYLQTNFEMRRSLGPNFEIKNNKFNDTRFVFIKQIMLKINIYFLLYIHKKI